MNYTLTATTANERCDSFLAREITEYSRSFWQKMCDQGSVQVNGTPAKASRRLAEGDIVQAAVPDPTDFTGHHLPVLYEDGDVLVINKPAGVLTHAKGLLSDEFTVAEFVRPRTSDGTHTNRPGIVHRLDRGTSGVVIAAKTNAAKRWLQKQFTERNVKKTYIALVEGHPKEPNAVLRLPIERNPRKPQTFRVGGNGKPAETTYETLHTYPHSTLLKLMPRTGRTHQLRVHMRYIGTPIVGDELYGSPNKMLGRMFLHAASLELTLPSRERKVFEAPLPPKLQQYLKTLA